MSKRRAPSTALLSNRKRSKHQHPSQAILDTYFRPPASAGEPSRRTPSHVSSSVAPRDEHGTLENPILLDLPDSEDPPEDVPGSESTPALRPSSSHIHSQPPTSDPCNNPTASQLTKRPTQLGLAPRPTEPVINYSPTAIDPLLYPIANCPWPADSPAPYSFLVNTLLVLVETRSRIAILNALTNTLRCLILYHPPSLLPSLYLMSNSLSPAYCPLELGIGTSVISKAMQNVSGLTPAALRKLYNSLGDPGDVAFAAKSNVGTLVGHPPLLIETVYESMLKIARVKGQGAARQKQSIVERLLVAAKGEETRFLVRTLSQNLRVGAVRTSILIALARALVLTQPIRPYISISSGSSLHATPQFLASIKPSPSPSPSKQKQDADPQRNELLLKFAKAEASLKQVYVQHPNYDDIVAGAMAGGLDGLPERVPLTVGIPLHPTLGSPVRSLDEVYERLNDMPFTAEFKYDGQRAQIHASNVVNGELSIHIFSRHLENMTEKYPDVVSLVRNMFSRTPDLQSFIIDSEIVALDPSDGGLRSFQELSNRARKDVNIRDIRVSVCVFAFDLMYLNNEVLLGQSLRARRHLLRTQFPAVSADEPDTAQFKHVNSCESEQGREYVETFWQEAVESRCEGLMIKLLDNAQSLETTATQNRGNPIRKRPLPATYEPDKRTSAWLKLKKDYVDGLGDTLDLVPVGAWHGNGRKAGWWSPVLLAIWDTAKENLVAVCKCMSGFSDAFYKDLTSRYTENSDDCSHHPQWSCDFGGFRPDVYFRPREIWEIRGADITLSPVSLAALGQVSLTRGLSLRFPRFLRVREDKCPEQATTSEFLARVYRDQENRGKDTGADVGDLIDGDIEVEAELKSDASDS